jgi:hypothetical protein
MKYLHKYQKHLNENSNIRNEIDKFLIEHNINGEIKKIKALELMPAQEEIFLDEIVSNFLERKKFIKKALKKKVKDTDIVVTSDNYIIDGNHEWATILILNPFCKIKCTKLNIPLKEAIEELNNLLKDIKSKEIKKTGDFKHNIYDLIEDKSKLKIILKDLLFKDVKKAKKFLKIVGKKIDSDLHPINYILKNIYKIPLNDIDIYDRNDMPQLSNREIEEILN